MVVIVYTCKARALMHTSFISRVWRSCMGSCLHNMQTESKTCPEPSYLEPYTALFIRLPRTNQIAHCMWRHVIKWRFTLIWAGCTLLYCECDDSRWLDTVSFIPAANFRVTRMWLRNQKTTKRKLSSAAVSINDSCKYERFFHGLIDSWLVDNELIMIDNDIVCSLFCSLLLESLSQSHTHSYMQTESVTVNVTALSVSLSVSWVVLLYYYYVLTLVTQSLSQSGLWQSPLVSPITELVIDMIIHN